MLAYTFGHWPRPALLYSRLFGVDARDPTIYAVALGGLLVAAMTALLLSARRAARIGPAEALRE